MVFYVLSNSCALLAVSALVVVGRQVLATYAPEERVTKAPWQAHVAHLGCTLALFCDFFGILLLSDGTTAFTGAEAVALVFCAAWFALLFVISAVFPAYQTPEIG